MTTAKHTGTWPSNVIVHFTLDWMIWTVKLCFFCSDQSLLDLSCWHVSGCEMCARRWRAHAENEGDGNSINLGQRPIRCTDLKSLAEDAFMFAGMILQCATNWLHNPRTRRTRPNLVAFFGCSQKPLIQQNCILTETKLMRLQPDEQKR